ncbi:hypothetical protein HNR77_006043 [Paenibacillus sp. JGP012]|nr:hypothetical protein [Paenibacillus sp. JGP012]
MREKQKKPFRSKWKREQPYTKGDGFFVHFTYLSENTLD